MAQLIFTKEQVEKLEAFCIEHKLVRFFLAKDQGVYIGANVGTHGEDSFKNCIQFADGCDPSQSEDEKGDWYENSRYLCGGDDFGELLEISILTDILKRENWKNFIVTLTPTTLSFSVK